MGQRIALKQALAAGWHAVPDSRAANPEQAPPGAVALYARGPRLAWLLETPRGFELEIGTERRQLRVVGGAA